MTIDHSLAWALVENKTISGKKRTSFKNVLWKYLGKEIGEGPDVKVISLEKGDKFLLCSDACRVLCRKTSCEFVQSTPMCKMRDGLSKLALDMSSPTMCRAL